MDSHFDMNPGFTRPANYRIKIIGYCKENCLESLGAMRISSEEHDIHKHITTMDGRVRDQAELMGILNSLYEMHIPILSVELIKDDSHAISDHEIMDSHQEEC